MTSIVVDYLVKSIIFLFFDYYFIWNPLVLEENNDLKDPSILDKIINAIL